MPNKPKSKKKEKAAEALVKEVLRQAIESIGNGFEFCSFKNKGWFIWIERK